MRWDSLRCAGDGAVPNVQIVQPLCSIRWNPPVQAVHAVQLLRSVHHGDRSVPDVPNVPPLRFVPIVSPVQRFKTESGRRTSTFREFSKCRMAAMVNFFRSVKLVRDLGNLGKLGTGTLDHRTSNHAERALPSCGTKRISTRHFMAAAIRLIITREWPS